MIREFTLDLRAARRASGLGQVDCAHLMGARKSKIPAHEMGRQKPSVRDICTPAMIYGRSFKSLFAGRRDVACRGRSYLRMATGRYEPDPVVIEGPDGPTREHGGARGVLFSMARDLGDCAVPFRALNRKPPFERRREATGASWFARQHTLFLAGAMPSGNRFANPLA